MPTTPVWSTYIAVQRRRCRRRRLRRRRTTLIEPFDVLDAAAWPHSPIRSEPCFSVSEANRHIGAQLVNEPNTSNWSDLDVRPGGVQGVLRCSVRLAADTVDFGYGQATMFRRPGYGRILDLKTQTCAAARPLPGGPLASTTLGWIRPMTADQFPEDLPPHWSVTFAVDDTDAMVQRATELGGRWRCLPWTSVRSGLQPCGSPRRGFPREPVSAGPIRCRSEISTIRRSIDVEERVAASSP